MKRVLPVIAAGLTLLSAAPGAAQPPEPPFKPAINGPKPDRLSESELLSVLRSPAYAGPLRVSLKLKVTGSRQVSEQITSASIDGVRFYFGKQDLPAIERVITETKADATAPLNCGDAFAEALKALAADARAHGANAVVDVRSDQPGFPWNSTTSFICASPPSPIRGPVKVHLGGRLVTLAADG